MSKVRSERWLALLAVGVGLLVVGIPGLWLFMKATATPLHPTKKDVPSSTHSKPLPRWAGSVDEARQLIRTTMSEQNLPGISVAVGIDNNVVWAEGFGFADVEDRLPVTPRNRFRIGSASTVLTSAAVGVLLEKGRLRLDDEIQTYVPAFPKKQWPVTLRQLMGHVAGVRTDGGDEGPLFSEQCTKPVEALEHFADRPLLFEPGTEFRYSSYGWILVSAAVEAAGKTPFLTFMQRQILDPLGMHDTVTETSTEALPGQVTSYFPRFAADPRYGLQLMRDVNLSCYAGSSAYLSTPTDLVRFGMAVNGGRLLQRTTVETLETSQRLKSGKETGYGLGWDLKPVPGGSQTMRSAGHDGKTLGGMVASLITLPDRAMAVSVTSNMSYTDTFSLASKIARSFAESQPR